MTPENKGCAPPSRIMTVRKLWPGRTTVCSDLYTVRPNMRASNASNPPHAPAYPKDGPLKHEQFLRNTGRTQAPMCFDYGECKVIMVERICHTEPVMFWMGTRSR